jgi:Protein of unknown function (DUF3800)
MNNIGGESRFIGFLDECGDHSMEKIDKDFPLFVLALVIFERSVYAENLIPAMSALKLRYWNHEGVNLHSREIRKQIGPFSFLHHPEKRQHFIADISQLMETMPFTLFVTGIKKLAHQQKYGIHAANPYELALTFTLERVLYFLWGEKEMQLPIVAEARGKQEDKSLELAFLRTMSAGTQFIKAEDFKTLSCPLVFRSKRDNVAGTQIADLCAYPCARHILEWQKPNPAFQIVRKHFYAGTPFGGLKVFP